MTVELRVATAPSILPRELVDAVLERQRRQRDRLEELLTPRALAELDAAIAAAERELLGLGPSDGATILPEV